MQAIQSQANWEVPGCTLKKASDSTEGVFRRQSRNAFAWAAGNRATSTAGPCAVSRKRCSRQAGSSQAEELPFRTLRQYFRVPSDQIVQPLAALSLALAGSRLCSAPVARSGRAMRLQPTPGHVSPFLLLKRTRLGREPAKGGRLDNFKGKAEASNLILDWPVPPLREYRCGRGVATKG